MLTKRYIGPLTWRVRVNTVMNLGQMKVSAPWS